MELLTWSLYMIPLITVIVLSIKVKLYIRAMSNGFFKRSKFEGNLFEIWITGTVLLIVMDLFSQVLIK